MPETSDIHFIFPGLDRLSVLIKKWTAEPSTYSPAEMRGCLDSWREVLFTHLDQEVIISFFSRVSIGH